MFRILNKIKSINCLFLVISLCFFSQLPAEQNQSESLTPTTQRALQRFQKLDFELANYGGLLSEKLLICSYLQDAWLAFLHDAESIEEYHTGMELFDQNSDAFKKTCHYITTIFNFYTGDYDSPEPQLEPVQFDGEEVLGFLNTFKLGRDLTPEEREIYYKQEETNFLRDCLVKPFSLNESNFNSLTEEVVYNFALLPDGTIRTALERPGNREYHVRDDETVEEAFRYPNHTILAGSPHQVVVTAGSFIIFRHGEKFLFFISCKSGHFQPDYNSLKHMKTQLTKLGIHPSVIICAPDVDLSRAILKRNYFTQVPVAITSQDTKELFELSKELWNEVYQKIDRELLNKLAQGQFDLLSPEIIEGLNHQREEATYARSAYNLFTEEHKAPKLFHKLVRRFGRLKDAIKHDVKENIASEASKMLETMEKYEAQPDLGSYTTTDDQSFYEFIDNTLASMYELLSHEKLLVEDYHQFKKLSRELGTFFMYLSKKQKWQGKGYFIYRSASEIFFEVNEILSTAHDDYIAKVLKGEINKDEEFYIEISPRNIIDFKQNLQQLGFSPTRYAIEIGSDEAAWMINWAKEWYLSHRSIVNHKDDKTVSLLLKSIVNGNYQYEDYEDALSKLDHLQRDAELARNALIFLDKSHQAPTEVHTYIKYLKRIIHAIKNHEPSSVKDEAEYILNLDGVPTMALENWECTDQESFAQTLQSYLLPLHNLLNEETLSKTSAEKIVTHLRAIQDLMNLFRRNGISKKSILHTSLPMVCYDSIEEHAHALILKMEDALEKSGDLSVIQLNADMNSHANFILSRIFL